MSDPVRMAERLGRSCGSILQRNSKEIVMNMKQLFRAALTLVVSASIAANTFGKDIVETAVADGHFKTLTAALGAAGLVDHLKTEGPFTVFATLFADRLRYARFQQTGAFSQTALTGSGHVAVPVVLLMLMACKSHSQSTNSPIFRLPSFHD